MRYKLEEYEIKILVDDIPSSKFIIKKNTYKLIDKVSRLNSVYISKDFNRKILRII